MSQWQNIYTHLKQFGFDVYSPAQHQGECVSPYVVVKDTGVNQIGAFSSVQAGYDIMCYVPQSQFSTLELYVSQVKEAMKGLYPMIVSRNSQTPSFYDDSVKGHMISIQYRNNQKL